MELTPEVTLELAGRGLTLSMVPTELPGQPIKMQPGLWSLVVDINQLSTGFGR